MSVENLRIEIVGPETVDEHLGQLMLPEGMKPLLREQMATRGMRMVAGFIGGRVVANGLWNPDSPTRTDTLRHIPPGTPSISMMETRPEYRGHGYATLVLDAICDRLREEGYTHAYLTANPDTTYDRPGGDAQSLDAFYTGRGFEDWGRGQIPLAQHAADTTKAPEDAMLNVYIKSLVPGLSAGAILLPGDGNA